MTGKFRIDVTDPIVAIAFDMRGLALVAGAFAERCDAREYLIGQSLPWRSPLHLRVELASPDG